MRRAAPAAIAGLLLALSACGRAPAAHDETYYRAHEAERQAQVARCSADPRAAVSPECMAALKAQGAAESQRALPYTPPASRLKDPGSL